MARSGVLALPFEECLELFDMARGMEEPVVVPVRLDIASLRAQAIVGTMPSVLRGLVRTPARRVSQDAGGSLARRLAGIAEGERLRTVLDLVRGEAAVVLGHASATTVPARRAFKDLGFDSLAAVELRNRLGAATGLRLPATLVFDYPTPTVLAGRLLQELTGVAGHTRAPAAAIVSAEEPIAIVGMGCRFPGGVRSAEQLWELVATGGDAIAEFPTDRGWDLAGLYDPDPAQLGTSYAREGGFLYDAGEFDAPFFEISPREALAMDPQQRLLLEICWEACEHAEIDPATLHGSNTGVFAGVSIQDYGPSLHSAAGALEGYRVTGSAGSVVSGRVSYAFGFEGPAMTIDTACSSSLVALHLASQALRQSECSMALAGGVTVMATPGLFVEFSRQRGLAPDGRCKAFASAADGAGFSEGAGVVLLERLSDARRLGHPVLAVVRGSAINQDGASNGLTAPNGPSQQRVIAQALASARLTAGDVDAVEAHGTGTMLGDPIEAQALLATYGQGRPPDRPLWLGSVKSNIGHTQAAAGVAGVIKMAMALRHGVLPKTLHVDEPSREVDWSEGAVSLLTEQMPWAAEGRPRRAAVSSFGVSGTNAHAILEEAPPHEAPVGVDGDGALGGDAALGGDVALNAGAVRGGDPVLGGDAVPWPVSGRGIDGLRGQAQRLHEFVRADADLNPLDIGLSLAGRPLFEHRAVVVGADREDALAGLAAVADGASAVGVIEGVARGTGSGATFVFPGQGSQWVGMAAELLQSSAVFAQSMASCDEALKPFVDWSLEEVLRGVNGAPGLERVDVVQPALFAVMVSLAALWQECGVRPNAVLGHSQGEIAAAYVAGGLSLGDAARVVALRSRALTRLADLGGMVSVACGVEEIEQLLGSFDGRVGVAAVNGPGAVVVSGEPDALAGLLQECEARGLRAREIPVNYAAHSPQVQEIREELLEGCSEITPSSSSVPFYSAVTGGLLDTASLDAEYWYRNLRDTVQFERAVQAALGDGCEVFVEVSPHPVLTVGVLETAV